VEIASQFDASAFRFLVVLPTWQRAKFLPQAIESVLSQTHGEWRLLIIDDGSTDDTAHVVEPYFARDSRILYVAHKENMGGVAANHVGMLTAISGPYDAWTRLGSDDWWLPRKLELDAIALRYAGACFGPYQNEPADYTGELNVPMDARAALLRGEFAASWANVAYRTEVLRKVCARHGNFVDPRIRSMEDNLFNIRAARFTEFVYRAELADGRIVVGAQTPAAPDLAGVKPDARYRIGSDPVCCSNSQAGRAQSAKDMDMTMIVRGEDSAKNYSVEAIEPVPMVILERGAI
jgi:hypothetical protein